jgi:hypothetical protein
MSSISVTGYAMKFSPTVRNADTRARAPAAHPTLRTLEATQTN